MDSVNARSVSPPHGNSLNVRPTTIMLHSEKPRAKRPLLQYLIVLLCALLLSGCKRSEAENLYRSALLAENAEGGQAPYSSIEAYRKVIRAAPASEWADKAQARIDAIQIKHAARNAAWSRSRD